MVDRILNTACFCTCNGTTTPFVLRCRVKTAGRSAADEDDDDEEDDDDDDDNDDDDDEEEEWSNCGT